jgi:CheY-like chemotaxis protein
VRSELGVGTTVSMILPAVVDGAESVDDEAERPVSQLGLRVLVVEDNAEVAAAIRPVLESLGCTVTHFEAARPALDWLRGHAADFDAVLTDVVMPGEMNGVALAREVRQQHPQLRLVVMTGYAEQMEEITRQGFTVLAKPWDARNLVRVLRRGEEAAP